MEAPKHPIPELYKFCRKEHNIALSATKVRIGSLSYYRAFEDAEIGDKEEGVKKHPGQVNRQKESIPVYHMVPTNCLVFSLATDLHQGLAEYDSCYKITDAVAFSKILAQGILDTLHLSDIIKLDFDDPNRITMWNLKSIAVQMERRPIFYINRAEMEAMHYDFKNEELKDPLMEMYTIIDNPSHPFSMYNIPFVKDIAYANQQEFRFVFRIYRQDVPRSEEFIDLQPFYLDVDLARYKKNLPVELVY